MHEVLVNRLGGLNLPRKSVVRLTDRLDMTLDVYRGRKTTIQQRYYYMTFSVAAIVCRCFEIKKNCNISTAEAYALMSYETSTQTEQLSV